MAIISVAFLVLIIVIIESQTIDCKVLPLHRVNYNYDEGYLNYNSNHRNRRHHHPRGRWFRTYNNYGQNNLGYARSQEYDGYDNNNYGNNGGYQGGSYQGGYDGDNGYYNNRNRNNRERVKINVKVYNNADDELAQRNSE